MTDQYLFVYGLMRKGMSHEMSDYLIEHTIHCGKGYVKGKLFDLGFYPGIVLAPGQSEVIGDIYRIPAEKVNEVLLRTDEFEEYGPNFSFPYEYVRKNVPVRTDKSGEELECWVYEYNRSVEGEKQILSGDYIDHILRFKVK